jgi:NADH dehydrogenase
LIVVDQKLRSLSHPSIYAVGDAAVLAESSPFTLRMACATAIPMGAHAADNIFAEINTQTLNDFSLGYNGQCISLGRNDALIQICAADDRPLEKVYTGRVGRFIKEFICRYTIRSINWQRRGWFNYRWPKALVKSQHREPITVESTMEI